MSLWYSGTTPTALTKGASSNPAAGLDEATPLPRLMRSVLAHRFIAVACGGAHAMALTSTGKLFAWGWNKHGQLGLGSLTAYASDPRPVGFFTGKRVGAIACGTAHSMAIVANDADYLQAGCECFTWGAHASGQLGHPAKVLKLGTSKPRSVRFRLHAHLPPGACRLDERLPRSRRPRTAAQVEALSGMSGFLGQQEGTVCLTDGTRISSPLACGAAHSAIITKVRTASMSALPPPPPSLPPPPPSLPPPPSPPPRSHRSARDPTLDPNRERRPLPPRSATARLVLAQGGALYAWGSNEHGQCCQQRLGTVEPLQAHAVAAMKLVGVACGGAHTLVLTDSGRVYSFGLGTTGQLGDGSHTATPRPAPR